MKYILIVCLSLISVYALLSAAENPHGKMKFDCETCHSVDSFEEMTFDHSLTGYELENRHQIADCRGCHDIADFSKVKKNCISCHQDVHKAKMGNDCQSCHTTRGWEQFDIETVHMKTNFPISGRHALVDCQSCHKQMPAGDFSLNTTRCVDCHQMDYLTIANPEHANNGFSTDCESCHQMNLWRPARFDNHDVIFPIFSGNHKNEWDVCASCHINPNSYQNFNCLNCHEHNQTETDIDHNGITGYGYNSPDCYFCHPTGEAGFFQDHDAQFFPIYIGSHNSLWSDCNECHINPTDRKDFSCVGCHVNPETDNIHGGMTGYTYNSPDCYSCHPTGKKGLFTDHDAQFFPIFSGSHNSQWDDCTQCHTNPSTRQEFSCLQCHVNPETDNIHGGMTGYLYNSQDCYLCHPTGDAGQFTDHDAQFFPIFSGTHNGTWADCAVCHTTPTDRKIFTCIPCHEHNQTDLDNMHGGMTGYIYTSDACYSCHPTGLKGQFTEHDAQFFPIYSGAHINRWDNCVDCHPTLLDRTIFSCFQCHTQPQMDDKHSEQSGYAYDSNFCLSCHPDGRH